MTLQSSGSISFSQIEKEFGANPGRSLGNYRNTVNIGGQTWPIDNGVPTGSSSISFSSLYGKQHNIVALMSGGQVTRQVASDDSSFNSTAFRGTSASVRRESKNIVYVVRVIGSDKNSRNRCALRTGNSNAWYGSSGPNGGKISIIIGSSGALYGAGGDGGTGGTEETDGDNGQSGTSALGLEVNVESITINSGGTIQAGGGGGGGGGGAREDSDQVRRAGGGGGGGGVGLPAGNGGGISEKNNQSGGENGFAGSLNSAGNGGTGGNNDNEASGGGGGGGGSFAGNESGLGGEGGDNSDDTDGSNGNDTNGTGGNGGDGKVIGGDGDSGGESAGGSGGTAGYAITRDVGISAPTILGETSNVLGQQGEFGVS
jgi:hypothetical protein